MPESYGNSIPIPRICVFDSSGFAYIAKRLYTVAFMVYFSVKGYTQKIIHLAS